MQIALSLTAGLFTLTTTPSKDAAPLSQGLLVIVSYLSCMNLFVP
jgi:hypothetical protein